MTAYMLSLDSCLFTLSRCFIWLFVISLTAANWLTLISYKFMVDPEGKVATFFLWGKKAWPSLQNHSLPLFLIKLRGMKAPRKGFLNPLLYSIAVPANSLQKGFRILSSLLCRMILDTLGNATQPQVLKLQEKWCFSQLRMNLHTEFESVQAAFMNRKASLDLDTSVFEKNSILSLNSFL